MLNGSDFDVVVAGAGPAGLASACLLAQAGCSTACIAPGIERLTSPRTNEPVRRTVALMQPAIRLLAAIGVWPGRLQPGSAPLDLLKIVDDTLATFTAPPVTFSSSEIGDGPFGWNIPLDLLVHELAQAAKTADVTLIDASVSGSQVRAGKAELSLDTAKLC